MNLFSNILVRCYVRLCRFRHRRGYGIHSPFAFGLVTKVFYERGAYYAYAPLRKMRRQIAHNTTERGDRLMLRLINAFQPNDCFIGGEQTQLTAQYLRAGKRANFGRSKAWTQRKNLICCISTCPIGSRGQPRR